MLTFITDISQITIHKPLNTWNHKEQLIPMNNYEAIWLGSYIYTNQNIPFWKKKQNKQMWNLQYVQPSWYFFSNTKKNSLSTFKMITIYWPKDRHCRLWPQTNFTWAKILNIYHQIKAKDITGRTKLFLWFAFQIRFSFRLPG